MTNGTRCVVVVDEALAPGLAANAAAVMALTLGTKVPAMVGEEFVDGAGERHPGLITTGLPVLRAAAGELPGLRARALEAEVGVIGVPRSGQTTTDYEHFRAMVAETEAPDYLGLAF
jgi:uracil phosphoribosyltransferase